MIKEAQQQMLLLEEVHESLVSTIEDDKEFEEAETWMQDCQFTFTSVMKSARMQMELEKDKQSKDNLDSKTKKKDDSNSVSTINDLRLYFELPKAEIQQFSGDSGQYWFFITNFETNIASKLTNLPSKLQYLIQFCTGEARACIEACTLLGDKGYEKALCILKTQFGQPHLVLNALMTKLTKRKQLSPGDTQGLWKLVGDMTQCEVTLTQMGYTSDLNSTSNLLKIQSLLPKFMQAKWVAKAHEILERNEPTFKDMLEFIQLQAKVASTMFGRNLEEDKSNPVTRQRTYNSNTQNNSTEPSSTFNIREGKCPCCN